MRLNPRQQRQIRSRTLYELEKEFPHCEHIVENEPFWKWFFKGSNSISVICCKCGNTGVSKIHQQMSSHNGNFAPRENVWITEWNCPICINELLKAKKENSVGE
jgi:hypothetical protein